MKVLSRQFVPRLYYVDSNESLNNWLVASRIFPWVQGSSSLHGESDPAHQTDADTSSCLTPAQCMPRRTSME